MPSQKCFVTMPQLISILKKYCDDKGLEYADIGDIVCARMKDDVFLTLHYNPADVVYINGKLNYVYGAYCNANMKYIRTLFADDMEYLFRKLLDNIEINEDKTRNK